MPFIRLSDNYIDHPKFLALSASAFRLWHEGLAFCRKHQTDGAIPAATVSGFRYFHVKLVRELATPWRPGAVPLWEADGDGYHVHDYLEWNVSREDEQAKALESKARTKRWRTNRVRDASQGDSSDASPDVVRDASRDAYVPDRIGTYVRTSGSERESERKPHADMPRRTPEDAISDRAGRLVEAYGAWYLEHRHGARSRASSPNLDWTAACDLCRIWPDDRLAKLAVLVLTTDDPWISGTDRSFRIFAMKASWADDRLKQWELEHGVTV